jgi:hypothetical protein
VSELKTAHPDEYGSTTAVPNFKVLGARLGKRMAAVAAAVKKLTPQEIAEFQKAGSVTVEGETLGSGEVRVSSRTIRCESLDLSVKHVS